MAEADCGVRAAIGLGSNLDDPEQQIERALLVLAHLPQTEVLARSRSYRSPPWGLAAQPEFVNAVASVRTLLAPPQLLAALFEIERAAGRERGGERWGPRRIDLDLLTYGAQRVALPGCQVPHPRLAERAFVLVPLAEIAPELVVPGLGRVDALLERLPRVERDAILPLPPRLRT
jgi:2-amino-4-hydroxy-6-hydroxymethyldihydropteridine diphosphokinase